MRRLVSPLQHREFALLWAGQSISWVGNIFYEVALLWFVLVLTGSTTTMAGVAFVSAIPQLIFAPIAGVVADRVNRRLLALSMDVGRALIVLSIPTLAVLHHLALPYIFVAAFLLWTCFTFFLPARTSLLANLVPEEELTSAMALMQTTMNTSWLLGAALGGAIVAGFGSVAALYIDAVTFLASIGTLALIRSSGFKARPEEASNGSTLSFALEGLRFLRHDHALRTILTVMLVISLLVGPFIVLEAPFSRLVLHTGAFGYGLLQASFVAGSVVGALAAGAFGQVRRVGLLMLGVILGVGVLTVGYSYSRTLIVAMVFILGVGVLAGVINIPIITLVQKRTPDPMRGRVNSALTIANGSATPVSIAVTGALVSPLGIAGTYRLGGIGFILLGIGSLAAGLARLRDDPSEPEEPVQEAVG